MKFTTLVPTNDNNGFPFRLSFLRRLVDALWKPFAGMTDEGLVSGHWVDDDGTEFQDTCVKFSIECEGSRLTEAIRRVKRIGRELGQRAIYFEVSGYDGVQILRIEKP